jgi:hypothetical protein
MTIICIQISHQKQIKKTWRSRNIKTVTIKFCLWLATGWWFSSNPPVSSTNKTDRYDIAEILLKVALSTITLNPTAIFCKLLTSISLRKPRSKWYHSSLLLHYHVVSMKQLMSIPNTLISRCKYETTAVITCAWYWQQLFHTYNVSQSFE